MHFALVASGKKAFRKAVIKMTPLQTAKKITGVLQLALPSGVGPRTMQAS